MTKFLIAHDLGTSGDKATLFTTDGELVKSITYVYDTHFFNSTWAEQNPDDWWKAICENNEELLKEIDRKQVAGMAFSGQMMGCVPVDKNGRALRPAIIWADQRSQDQEKQNDQILEMLDEGIEVLFLNPVDWETVEPALKACQEKGVIVINMDTVLACFL